MRWAIFDAPVEDASELMVLIAICERTDERGRNAYPSVAWIASHARCSVRTAHRHIQKLRKEGLVKDGDPSLVASFRADRRPGVYDVDMARVRASDLSSVTPRPAGDESVAAHHDVSPVSPREDERRDSHDMSSVSRRAIGDRSCSTPRGDKRGIHGVTPVADNSALPPTEVIPPFVAADAAHHGDQLFVIPGSGPGPVLPTDRPERIPADFATRVTAHMRAWAAETAPLLVIDAETENFVDWWMSKGGPDGKKLDWVKTWKVWMRKEQKETARRQPRNRQVVNSSRAPGLPEGW